MATSSKGVVCVGLACLDIINYCDHYPQEDEDVRASAQKWCKGGNAANTLSVLRLLGREQCHLFGTLGCGMETDFVISELDQLEINHTHCVMYPAYKLPTSFVLLNTTNGSRTIVHYRNLPELKASEFKSHIDLSRYTWIHFEGRNPIEVVGMISIIRDYNTNVFYDQITISIELEKKKSELDSLASLADVLFLSKDYASFHGYNSATEACFEFKKKTSPNSIIVCAWGEKGAAAVDSTGQLFTSSSFPPIGGLVDTLGAGDTFNAAVIHKLMSGSNIGEAIKFGCRVAGAKCGMEGFNGLQEWALKNT